MGDDLVYTMNKSIWIVDWLMMIAFALIIVSKFINLPIAKVIQPRLSDKEIKALELFDKRDKAYLRCLASDKDRLAKPEEIVRQLYIRRLINEYGYPKERIDVEKGGYFGSAMAEKRADIVVSEEGDPDTAYIII